MCSHTQEVDRQLLCREERVCWFCAIGSGPRVNEHVRAEVERHDSLTPAFSILPYSLIYSHSHMHAHNQHSSLFLLQKAGLQIENKYSILLICFVHIQAELIPNFIKQGLQLIARGGPVYVCICTGETLWRTSRHLFIKDSSLRYLQNETCKFLKDCQYFFH